MPLQGASSQPWRVCRTNRIEASAALDLYRPSATDLGLYVNGVRKNHFEADGSLWSDDGGGRIKSFGAIQSHGGQSLTLYNSAASGAPAVDWHNWLRMQANSSGDLLLDTGGSTRHQLYGNGGRAMAAHLDGGMLEGYYRGSTTNATPLLLGSFALADPSAWGYAVSVLGVRAGHSQIVRYELDSAFRRVGGVTTQVTGGPSKVALEDAASCDASMAAPGANADLTVTGIAAQTWYWSAYVRRWPMSSV